VISTGVNRARASVKLGHAIRKHGHNHPATWAAWGRHVAVWGIRRSPMPPFSKPSTELLEIAAVAYARASSSPGDSNRAHRAHQGAFS